MKEESSFNPSAEPDQPDTDLVSLLKKMQQQLLLLEKKVDLLISRSQEKSFGERPSQDRPFRKRPFSKPFRSFDHSHRHGKGEREHNPRERDSAPGHFYERRPQEKSRGSNPRKKPFVFKRKDRE
jgi:hypothetical protein